MVLLDSEGKDGLERAERSLRIVVRCLSAELKVVFWQGGQLARDWRVDRV